MTPMQRVDELLDVMEPYDLIEELVHRLPSAVLMPVLGQIVVDYDLYEEDD